jgi:hypothetical protein
MQAAVFRSAEADRLQQIGQQQPRTATDQAGQEVQKHADLTQSEVTDAPKSEDAEIRERYGGGRRGRREKKKEEEQEPQQKKPKKRSIDFRA